MGSGFVIVSRGENEVENEWYQKFNFLENYKIYPLKYCFIPYTQYRFLMTL